MYDFWSVLWVVALDGSEPAVLPRSHDPWPSFDELQPAWSPDGARIAVMTCNYTRGCGSPGQLVVMNADGSSFVVVATATGYAHPTWSPDGRVIAFASDNSIEWISVDGSRRGRIIANGTSPAWRPGN